MDNIHPNMGIHHHGIGCPEHNSKGVKMPLNLLKDNQAASEAVPENHLQDNGKNQDAIGPHDHMTGTPNESVQSITKLIRDLFLCIFSIHFNYPDKTELMWIYKGRSETFEKRPLSPNFGVRLKI